MTEYPKNHHNRRGLIEDLLRKGYPLSSFVLDWRHGEEEYDLAIIDRDIEKPLAVFDSMGYQHPAVITSGPIRELAERMGKLREEYKIPLIIYSSDKAETIVYFYYLRNSNDGAFEMPRIEKLATYAELQNFGVSRERKRQIDALDLISYFVAAIIGLLLLIDIFHPIITGARLSMVALIVFLLVLPHAAALKVLGFEYLIKNKGPDES